MVWNMQLVVEFRIKATRKSVYDPEMEAISDIRY